MKLHFKSGLWQLSLEPPQTPYADTNERRNDVIRGITEIRDKGRRAGVASDLGQFQSSTVSIHFSDSRVPLSKPATVRAARYYIVVCRQLSFTIRHIYKNCTHAYAYTTTTTKTISCKLKFINVNLL